MVLKYYFVVGGRETGTSLVGEVGEIKVREDST